MSLVGSGGVFGEAGILNLTGRGFWFWLVGVVSLVGPGAGSYGLWSLEGRGWSRVEGGSL